MGGWRPCPSWPAGHTSRTVSTGRAWGAWPPPRDSRALWRPEKAKPGFSTRRPDSSLCPRPCWGRGREVTALSPCPVCSSDARGDVQPDPGVVPRVSGPAQARVCAAGSFPLPGRGVCGHLGWTLGVRPGSLGCWGRLRLHLECQGRCGARAVTRPCPGLLRSCSSGGGECGWQGRHSRASE